MIGVFDSGLGGLTVVRELQRQLPNKGILYFGDTARMPYGTKGAAVIRKFAVQDAEFLVSKGATAIIVACNTASALAIDAVRAAVNVPVFDVVTPAVARAADLSRGRVGVIGTRGTVASCIHAEKMAVAAPETKVFAQACPLFVPLVEEGWHSKPEAATIAKAYLRPLRLARIDTLILGCTHYPFLRLQITKAVPKGVKIIDPAREAVADFVSYLKTYPELAKSLGASSSSKFYVSDRTEHFEQMATKWLGHPITLHVASVEHEYDHAMSRATSL